ncbi:aspartate kinase [Cytobacillus gottheilii]|uniref:aspartate kinase n=1 Tax=Cytobacillus gottheilii TaxID=859144 RepID=UPI0009B9F2E9|nr:aspartate kinase [Cytobacillus gottheilii]
MKVVKFGGSSLATGDQIKKVYQIVCEDPSRKIVVVSAPGKRNREDRKVTDLLIDCAEEHLSGEGSPEVIAAIFNRYENICNELALPLRLLDEIKADFSERLMSTVKDSFQFYESIKACGENYMAWLVACYFQKQGLEAEYINPESAGLIVSSEPGNAQVLPSSYEVLARLKTKRGIIVFPGFFGYSEDGEIMTFSRSGSDVTGAVLAKAVKADVYENFTDVDAVYSVNPAIVLNPKEIRELTYREMRELSYGGFTVLHDEALIPAFSEQIPVHIRNTNNPSAAGTRIVSSRDQVNGPVVGIASDHGFCSIYVSKYLMNREIGFGRRLLTILEEFGLSYEHSPSGIDDISIILREAQLTAAAELDIIERIKLDLQADEVVIQHHLSLIMVVGEGMRHNVGTMSRASKALAEAGVNIEMINQGSSEVSMMFGVKVIDEKRAVTALYEEFFAAVPV